jgi:hypothetical protein
MNLYYNCMQRKVHTVIFRHSWCNCFLPFINEAGIHFFFFSFVGFTLFIIFLFFLAYRYKAKEVFIKGLQDIPSAKVLGLDLIHYLDQNPQRHTSEAIQAEVQDIFAEKEVRFGFCVLNFLSILSDFLS